ncbi:hypothetical protein BFP70_02425 [Thioclava sp. SK-1]|uniref:head-tail connector protein n=1 Tax=Thioclava sp. SK-1 TaxID=1889770 RepID=UPI00082537EA|nr:hypothetical protein [Thioclava sp. SK-1]OCX67213.1 hypothetical protein BFP70_02425 [Thioclava sp. SK-1]
MLTQLTEVAAAALPVAALRDHLRLGRGFADVGAEDAALEGYLRASLATIERRTGKALLGRDCVLTLYQWRCTRHPLPLSPVQQVSAIVLVDRNNMRQTVDPARYRLVRDMSRPLIEGLGQSLPDIPLHGHAEITLQAGFGVWAQVPADLAQAVMLLAATYFEHRHERGAEGDDIPFGVACLIEPWRTVRLIGGRR